MSRLIGLSSPLICRTSFPSWFARCGSVPERCVGVGEAFGGGGEGFVDDGISRGRAGQRSVEPESRNAMVANNATDPKRGTEWRNR